MSLHRDAKIAIVLVDEEIQEIDRELCIFYDISGKPIQIIVGLRQERERQIPLEKQKDLIILPTLNVTSKEFNAWAGHKEFLDDLFDETRRRCPNCHSSQDVKEILYGYAPIPNQDQVAGGCCVGPERWICIKCKVRFIRSDSHEN